MGEGLIRREDLHDNMLSNWDTIGQLSNPNLLINGDFQVWQRGTSFTGMTSGVKYNADRWYTHSADTSFNISKTTKGLSIKKTNTTSYWSHICQCLETDLANKLCGKYLTLSVKVVGGGAGVSACIYLGVPSGNSGMVSCNLTTGINTVTYKVPDTIGSSIGVALNFSSCVVNTSLEVEWVKLEIGDKATPFIPRLFAEELAICKRYYEKNLGFLSIIATSDYFTNGIKFEVTKRATPTITIYAVNGTKDAISDTSSGTIANCIATIYAPNMDGCGAIVSSQHVLITGAMYYYYYTADSEIYY